MQLHNKCHINVLTLYNPQAAATSTYNGGGRQSVTSVLCAHNSESIYTDPLHVFITEYIQRAYTQLLTELLTVYLYLVNFYLAAFKRHYALHLAIAPEFFCCS